MKLFIRVIICSIVFAGCTVGPDYQRPEIELEKKWRYQLKNAADVADTAWWKQFQDPVLDDLVSAALLENRDVRFAAARVEQFAALLGITRSEFFPQAGYDIAASRDQASRAGPVVIPPGTDSITSTYLATLNVGWELDVWGRIRRASEAAQADLLATEEGRRAVILTLVSSLATSYVTLRSLDKQLEISKRTLETRAEALRLFELQFKGGVISMLTLSQVRSEYEQAAVAIPSIERQIAQQENLISILLGHNPGPIPRGLPIDKLLLPKIPAGVPSDLLTRRPDIRRAEDELISANANIGVARAEYFPRISLTALAGYASGDLSDLLTRRAGVWSYGADAFGAIFTAGSRSGNVRRAESVQKQALVNYQQTILTALREVNDALIETYKRREQLEAQSRRIEALVEYARLARLRYDNGYTGYLEVLDAERSLFDSELNYVQVQNDVFVGLINTYKSMGGGWIKKAEAIANETDFPPSGDSSTWFEKILSLF